MAYDEVRQVTVAFGGWQNLNGGTYHNDTVLWDGRRWWVASLQMAPSPRRDHAVAYDAARAETVMFGGQDGHRQLGDTWLWNGSQWTAVSPVRAPAARHHHAMSYDPRRQRVVLFGGSDNQGPLDDTWEWDGVTWQKMTPVLSPPARAAHALAYDPVRGVTLLFGGKGNTDTWAWDGAAWTKLQADPSPAARGVAQMTLDPVRKKIVLYGGLPSRDVWEWDSSRWSVSTMLRTPAAYFNHAMAYHAANQRLVMFGGSDGTRTLAEAEYLLVAGVLPYGVACGPNAGASLTGGGTPQIGKPLLLNAGNLAPSALGGVIALGFSRSNAGPFPLPLPLMGFGLAGCWLHQSHDVVWPLSVTNGAGQFSVALPGDPRLVLGPSVYFQAYIIDPTANSAWTLTSNGVEVIIGR